MFRNWYANIPQTRGIYTDNTVFVPLTTQPVVFTSYKFNYRRRNERGIFKNHKVPSPKSLEYQIFGLLYYDYHVHINHFLTIQFIEKGNIKYWKHDNFITLKVKSLLYDIFTHVEWTPLCKSLCLEAHFLERKFEYQRHWTF